MQGCSQVKLPGALTRSNHFELDVSRCNNCAETQ
jgi:hypothetical protein